MAVPRPRVRVGIVSWNTADELDRCLASLPEALDGLEAEVVVVDNASEDDSAERAERHGGVRVIRNPVNEGYARAMNQALAGTTAPALVALNPDTQAPPGSLRGLVDALLGDPSLALVVPQLRNDDGSLQHSVNRFPSVGLTLAGWLLPSSWHARRGGRHWWVPGTATHSVAQDIDWAIGAVHVIRAAALGGVAPYSERWFMYVEDLDLCWRLDRAGWRRRLEPGVWVTHTGNAAGVQAWGTDPALRWLPCSYDFYALARSNASARAWAGANALALLLWSAIGLAQPRWGPVPTTPGRKAHVRRIWMLRGHMRIHLTALIGGPRAMARRAARPGIGAAPQLIGPPPLSSGPMSARERERLDLLATIMADPPVVHAMDYSEKPLLGVWSTDIDCYEFMARHCQAGHRTLETGSGLSTVLLAAWGARHTCVTPSSAEAERIRDYCQRKHFDTSSLTFAVGPSEEMLPRATPEPLDLVLIDGNHGYPAPILDWFYAGRRLRRGGILLVDDTQLPAVGDLVRFIDADPRWERLARSEKWAAWRRLEEGDLVEDWVDQSFYAAPKRQGWDRLAHGLARRAKALRRSPAGRA